MPDTDREQWLAWRSGAGTTDAPTLGATDCAALFAAVMGWHAYRTPADVYAERWHGKTEEPLHKRMIAEMGTVLEPTILKAWAGFKGISTPKPAGRLQTPSYPWWRGSLDADPLAVDGRLTVVDAKTMRFMSAGHFFTAADAPCWPALYLSQVAQYAAVLIQHGHAIEAVTLAIVDVGDGAISERRALLTDLLTAHLDPSVALPEHDDGRPFTVHDLGLACLAYADRWRADYLLGDAPPCPPPDGPVADWWAAKPRSPKTKRPATAEEIDLLTEYAEAHKAEAAATTTKKRARDGIAQSMSATNPVAKIFASVASASISAAGRLTITTSKE